MTHRLGQALEERVVEGHLALVEVAPAWPGLARLLDCLPGPEPPVLASTELGDGTGDVRLQGRTSLLGFDGLTMELVAVDGGADHCDMVLGAPADAELELPAISALSIRGLKISLAARPDEAVSGVLDCTVVAGGRELPFSLDLPPKSTVWSFGGTFDPISVPNLSDAAELLGDPEALAFLPQNLLAIEGLELTAFSLGLEPMNTRLDHLQLGIAIDHWEIVPGLFTLEQVGLNLLVGDPAGDDGRTFSGSVAGTLELGDRRIPLGGIIDRGIRVDGYQERLAVRELTERFLGDLPAAFPDLELLDVAMSLSTRGEFTVSGSASTDFGDLVAAIGIQPPAFVTALELDRFSIEAHPLDGRWQFDVATGQPIALLDEGAGSLALRSLTVGLERTAESGITASAGLVLDGSATIAAEASLRFRDLSLRWTSGAEGWSTTGQVEIDLLGRTEELLAEVRGTGADLDLVLTRREDLLVTDFAGAGSALVRGLRVTVGLGAEGFEFGLGGELRLRLDKLFAVSGSVALEAGPTGPRLSLTTDPPELPAIKLPLKLEPSPEVRLDIGPLSLRTGTGSSVDASEAGALAESTDTGWWIEGTATLQIASVPSMLEAYLPMTPLAGFFRADAKQARVGCHLSPPLSVDFPPLAIERHGAEPISLGMPELSVQEIALALGTEPRLEERIRIDLPPELNQVLATVGLDLLNERFHLLLSLGRQLGLTPLDSPLRDLEFYLDEEGRRWTDWQFGSVGTIAFRVPELAFDAGRWRGSAGIRRKTELRLPLGLLKRALAASAWPRKVLDALPDALPLRDVDLTGDDFADELLSLAGPGSSEVGDSVTSFLEAAQGMISAMPERMQDYFVVRIPESGVLDLEIDTSGGTRLGFRTVEGESLRLLIPWLAPPLPSLVGITLREIGFGQRSQGALILLEIDGHLDVADLPSLAIGIPLGKAKDLTTRLLLEKTVLAIPAGLPVAIPLFFSQLGLEYRDLAGLELRSRWRFPAPDLGPWDWVEFFVAIGRYFFDRDFLLHQDGLPEALRLEMTIGENQIRLPDYLGGASLGLAEALPPLDIDDCICRFFDALKTLRPAYLVQAIPLRYPLETGAWVRVGEVEIELGPFAAKAQWCLTTRTELEDQVRPAVEAGEALSVEALEGIREALPDLPVDATADEEIIVLLMAATELSVPLEGGDTLSVLALRQQFGLSLTRQGLAVGMRWTGTLADRLSLDILGVLELGDLDGAAGDTSGIAVRGRLGLSWQDTSLIDFAGRIAVSNRGLEVGVRLGLSDRFYVDGNLLIGPESPFGLNGEIVWEWGPAGEILRLAGEVEVGGDGLALGFAWRILDFDATVTIAIPGRQGAFQAAVDLSLPPGLNETFRRGVTDQAKSVAGSSVDKTYNDLYETLGQAGDLELSINGLRNWLPDVCSGIEDTVVGTIEKNTEDVPKAIRRKALRDAQPFITRLRTLASVASIEDADEFRAKLKSSLQDIVAHNSLTVKVAGFKIGKGVLAVKFDGFTAYQNDDLMGTANVKRLEEAIGWVDHLKTASGLAVKHEQILGNFPPRERLLARVNQEIERGVGDALPEIASLGFATSLGILDPGRLDLSATVLYKGERQEHTFQADLADPAALARSLAEEFSR